MGLETWRSRICCFYTGNSLICAVLAGQFPQFSKRFYPKENYQLDPLRTPKLQKMFNPHPYQTGSKAIRLRCRATSAQIPTSHGDRLVLLANILADDRKNRPDSCTSQCGLANLERRMAVVALAK